MKAPWAADWFSCSRLRLSLSDHRVVRLPSSILINLYARLLKNCAHWASESMNFAVSVFLRYRDVGGKVLRAWLAQIRLRFSITRFRPRFFGRTRFSMPIFYGSDNYASVGMWRDYLRKIPPIGYFFVEIRGAGPCRGGVHTLHGCVRWSPI